MGGRATGRYFRPGTPETKTLMTVTTKRSPLNSVKILVRESALEMREFDVEKMVRATGCKLTSVSNEIRHMIEDGYLTSLKPTGPHSRRGKPISTYRLVDDEEKIERLLAEVRTFRPQRSQGKPEPQSRNYQRAREFLDQAANTEHEAEKEGLLKQAETLLKIARADEGEPESVKSAFLQFELGRLFFLRKDYQLADKLLRQS